VPAFDDLSKKLLSAYQQRFDEHYKTQTDKDLKLAHPAIRGLHERLKDTLTELKKR
jgi:hypothetical protein